MGEKRRFKWLLNVACKLLICGYSHTIFSRVYRKWPEKQEKYAIRGRKSALLISEENYHSYRKLTATQKNVLCVHLISNWFVDHDIGLTVLRWSDTVIRSQSNRVPLGCGGRFE